MISTNDAIPQLQQEEEIAGVTMMTPAKKGRKDSYQQFYLPIKSQCFWKVISYRGRCSLK